MQPTHRVRGPSAESLTDVVLGLVGALLVIDGTPRTTLAGCVLAVLLVTRLELRR